MQAVRPDPPFFFEHLSPLIYVAYYLTASKCGIAPSRIYFCQQTSNVFVAIIAPRILPEDRSTQYSILKGQHKVFYVIQYGCHYF